MQFLSQKISHDISGVGINFLIKKGAWNTLVQIVQPNVEPFIDSFWIIHNSSFRFVLATLGAFDVRDSAELLGRFSDTGDYHGHNSAITALGKIGNRSVLSTFNYGA